MDYNDIILGICNLPLYERHRIASALTEFYSEGISKLLIECHVCHDRLYEDAFPYSDFHKCYMQGCCTHICGDCWRNFKGRHLKLEGCYFYMCPLHNPVITSLFDKLYYAMKDSEYKIAENKLKN